MTDVVQTDAFRNWLAGLRDRRAVARIASRIALIERGALGDVKSLGGGLSEFKIDYGPGYRLFAAQRGTVTVILLCGGDKRKQQADIKRARAMLAELE
ncbi:type II toxin-antitoxin system RelE/ParE family toxin [Bradyrhizobium guangzhouense]|uniref:Type II toxin-antitoxin system RelE/ParE family toxin n=1 Tax=Bradyrhizobium guangzhouense TaxID=1325095 RepID=A0AAE5X758_9BRAD|nr:type II toxin-antitoxin system RelE/ParE family toxin [Bradyrhizobium guangzhouense]QAU50010.1 type II toxin-antitoxin system RelE/ParE family toxin [Bradyrhizobium guangzhouense]RXH16749.1 type II toxin-antitoxin system RelE/ParE family toxin [Bradyrhizobium guangzhouense]